MLEVGDRVVVLKTSRALNANYEAGSIGRVIVPTTELTEFDYMVRLEHDNEVHCYYSDELEKIK